MLGYLTHYWAAKLGWADRARIALIVTCQTWANKWLNRPFFPDLGGQSLENTHTKTFNPDRCWPLDTVQVPHDSKIHGCYVSVANSTKEKFLFICFVQNWCTVITWQPFLHSEVFFLFNSLNSEAVVQLQPRAAEANPCSLKQLQSVTRKLQSLLSPCQHDFKGTVYDQ